MPFRDGYTQTGRPRPLLTRIEVSIPKTHCLGPAVLSSPLLPLAWPWHTAEVVGAKSGLTGSSNQSP